MKATTYAAAAALVGAASASRHAHEHLHKRQDWSAWSSDPATSSDWDPTSTSSDWDPSWTATGDWSTSTSSYTDWDPKTSTSTAWGEWTTSTTTSYDPWGEWTTSSTSYDPWDPATCVVTDWASGVTTVTSTVYATETGTWDFASGPYTTTTTVTVTATWTSPVEATATSSAWAWSYDPSVCSVTVLTSTGEAVWLPDPTWTSVSTVYVTPIPATTTGWSDPSTWEDWTSSTTATSDWPTWTSSADPSDWAWTSTTAATADWTSVATATGHAVIAPSGSSWAMTYSPYTASSGCKDEGTIAADIAKIASKGFTSVRVYSTDCNTLEYVGNACRNNGLKIILGVFISSTGISGASQQVTDIVAWAQWDLVELVVVGNEAVFNGYCSASDLAWFISSVKGDVKGAGYTGPVTTTEPLSTWQSVGTTFCSAVDVVAANLYAFFNAQTTCDQAGTFIESEITILEGICSNLDVYVMETGWPSAGECNGVACPGWSEQATAINSIKDTTGAKVVFFTFEDDLWKEPGQFDVEQHWGCVDVFPDAGTVTTTSAYASSTGW